MSISFSVDMPEGKIESPESEEVPVHSIDNLILTEDVKKQLSMLIKAAKLSHEPLGNILIEGASYKEFEEIVLSIASELGVSSRIQKDAQIEAVGDLISVLTNLEEQECLGFVVGERWKIDKSVEDELYSALNNYSVEIIIGKGPSANSVCLELPVFNFICGAVSRYEMPEKIRDSFGFIISLSEMEGDPEYIRKLISRYLENNHLRASASTVNSLAENYTDRKALKKLLDGLKRKAIVNGTNEIRLDEVYSDQADLPNDHKKDMSEFQFLEYVASLLRANRYRSVRVVFENRFGVNLLAEKDDVRYAILCSNSQKSGDVHSVQDVLAGKAMYNCHVACVITDREYSLNARALAEKNLVILWGKEKLDEMMKDIAKKI